ncbi:MAG: SEC-C domain-containing protein [Nitrosopumilus sp.]
MTENKVFVIETQEGHERRKAIQRAIENHPIHVESIELTDWQIRKNMNADNKAITRRGFIDTKHSGEPFTHNAVQIGRNEPCHCGSGLKFKKCHMEVQRIQKTA